MLFSEFKFAFMVMALILACVESKQDDIPICEPPVLRCAGLKRSVCEWSASGEPVWACRGFFETLYKGPNKLQSSEVTDAAQQDSESDMMLGTYEYQIPQSSSKAVTQNDSSEIDVKYITYTIPIITKTKRNGASQVESKSEVNVETESVSPTEKGSSEPKTGSGSEVNIGTFSVPTFGNTSSEVGESDSNGHMRAQTYPTPPVIKSSVSKLEAGSSVHSGADNSSASTTGVSTDDVHDGSNSDVHIENHTTEVPTSKNISGLIVQAGTQTLPAGAKIDDVARAESESSVQVGISAPLESDPSSRSGVVAAEESDSQVLLGTNTTQVPSNKSSSENAISSQGNVDTIRRDSEFLSLARLLSPSPVNVLSSDSEANGEFGIYPVTVNENVVVQDDSKVNAASNGNQSVVKRSDSKVSAEVKIGTASSMHTSHSHGDPKSSDRSGSQSQNQIRSTVYGLTPARSVGHISESDSSAQQDSYSSSSGGSLKSVFNNDSEQKFKLGTGSVIPYLGCEKTHGGTVVAPSQLGTPANEMFKPERGLQHNKWGTHQQRVAGYPYVFNEQYLNGYAGSLHSSYSQNSHVQYNGGDKSLHGGYLYSGRDSHIKEHEPTSSGRTLEPYHLTLPFGTISNGAGHYQQYELNSAVGSGSAHHKNYGSVIQNKSPFNYLYHSGYQSLEQGTPSSPKGSVSSGSGLYYWPQTGNPLVSMGLGAAGYGLVKHNTPLVNLGLNGLAAPQKQQLPWTKSFFYGPPSLNSGSASSATSGISSRSHPLSQHESSRALGSSEIDLHACSFCKRLVSVCGGTAAICDVLEPAIREFFNKVLEIVSKYCVIAERTPST